MKTFKSPTTKVTEGILDITNDLLGRNPMPDTEDILVKTRHMNKYKLTAEEFAIGEIIKVAR